MSQEQPSLFENMEKPENRKETPREVTREAPGVQKKEYKPFLPGVMAREAYMDIHQLSELQNLNLACQKCDLRKTCKQVVFGAGDPEADLLFIGEGPGADEDESGIPFVGKAGKLLDKIFAAAEFDREKVFITNVVKCRPPGNRLPNPNEVKACRTYLEAQIRLIQPQIIVCLGSAATKAVIDPKMQISKVRGLWIQRNEIMMMPTYHPAALLRNESYKRPAWEDFKLIREAYKKLQTQ